MRTLIIAVIIIAVGCTLFYLLYSNGVISPRKAAEYGEVGGRPLPFPEGERLTYDVHYKKLKIGRSVLTFHGEKDLDGKKVYHITFSTHVPAFEDTEEIYAHKGSFLPYRVLRSIKKIGFLPTEIEETYDQEAFTVAIKQKSTFNSKEFAISKDSPIHNAILLTYYARSRPVIEDMKKFKVTLPTVEYDVVLKGKGAVGSPMGTYSAHVFESKPPKFSFWLSADEKRVPIKIESYNLLGYSLIISSTDNAGSK